MVFALSTRETLRGHQQFVPRCCVSSHPSSILCEDREKVHGQLRYVDAAMRRRRTRVLPTWLERILPKIPHAILYGGNIRHSL